MSSALACRVESINYVFRGAFFLPIVTMYTKLKYFDIIIVSVYQIGVWAFNPYRIFVNVNEIKPQQSSLPEMQLYNWLSNYT